MKWIDYRETLGIGFNDSSKFIALKNKILTLINYLEGNVTYDGFRQISPYEFYIEICEVPAYQGLRGVKYCFDMAKSMKDLLSKFVAFSNKVDTFFTFEEDIFCVKDFLPRALGELNIQFRVIRDREGEFIFPEGAIELDDALVSQPLEWLHDYPDARTAWIKALKDYAKVVDDTASDVADKFRKALETFFQDFFGGNKSLENYKADYGIYLKQKNVPKEISGNFETLLQAYTNYMNNYAKHRDATSDNVLEYLLYQTGNIIRLLITLEGQS